MNDQERQIISDIFRRLESSAAQSRDQDAERFIADKVKSQPYAPYAMAQSLYVQEEAMKSLNEQLEGLKRENEQLRSQGSGSGGGFLSSIFGGGQRPQPQAASFSRQGQPGYGAQQPGYGQPGPQGGPWGGGPQGGAPQQGGPWGGGGGFGQQAPAAGGGGFLKGALTTAAGVAGGMVVGNALMNAFSGGGHSALGSLSQANVASLGGGDAAAGGLGDGGASFSDANFGSDSAFGSDASFQDASFDDGGGFDSGGDDSSWT